MSLEFNPKTHFLKVDRAYLPLDLNRLVIELDGQYYYARYCFHDDIPGTGNNKLQPVKCHAPRENWVPLRGAEYFVYRLEHKSE